MATPNNAKRFILVTIIALVAIIGGAGLLVTCVDLPKNDGVGLYTIEDHYRAGQYKSNN